MSTTTGHPVPGTRAALAIARRLGQPADRRIRVPAGIREILVLAGLWIVYSASRLLADTDPATARHRADAIVSIEGFLHLDIEHWVNHAAASFLQLSVPMSFWYASLHYIVTPAVLVFLFVQHRPDFFVQHRPDFSRARNALVLGSALGLVCYVLIPTAPPRLMPGGQYIDSLAQTAGYGWWSGHASAPAGLGQVTNELAAMPSLHVGWTIWVAWAVWRHTGVVGHLVARVYVLGTTFVVIATGNHWLLDAVGGAVVIAAGIVLSGHLDARRSERQRGPAGRSFGVDVLS